MDPKKDNQQVSCFTGGAGLKLGNRKAIINKRLFYKGVAIYEELFRGRK